MRNADPHVVSCRTRGDMITFDKERAFQSGAPLQHVYGAVRFLTGTFSTFQLIAGGEAPNAVTVTAIENLVASFQSR